jgi:hypothetical protein
MSFAVQKPAICTLPWKRNDDSIRASNIPQGNYNYKDMDDEKAEYASTLPGARGAAAQDIGHFG